ncbi:MAG TPA: RsmE family RNA methyltransferase [Polyangiaceae bacterium]|nr:RsmE family RNA methyltransferase [Polyangiaceae bacterium]
MASRFRVPLSPLGSGAATLDADAGRYVARVHRLGPGDHLTLFDPDSGTEADATIVRSHPEVVCDVGPLRAGRVPSRAVTLVQALGKGDKPEQVVRDATALSVTRIVFVEAERSVPRVGDRAEAKRVRLRAVAVDAARQSGRGNVPEIVAAVPLHAAFRELPPGTVSLCLSPGAPESFGAVLARVSPDAPVAVFVGPEGGFTDGELSVLRVSGATLVSFGDLVLRTETAAAAVLGALLAHRR